MRDERLRMELLANAMTAKVSNDRIAILMGMIAAGCADITKEMPRLHCCDTKLHAFFRDLDQFLGLR